MITDVIFQLWKKDPLLKRNVLKTFSWRIVGSIDTMFLGWIVTGTFVIGAKIGSAELLTKMFLYYFHERIWQQIRFGLASKFDKLKIVQRETKPHLFKQSSQIKRADREIQNNNKTFTLWLTGLSGAGKSTLATELETWLYSIQKRSYILDGDNTRLGINSDLSFSDEDRSENIRRVAELSQLFNDAGIIVIASFISPFINDRLMAKEIIGDGNFIEIYVDADISVCKSRDTKGLYKLASAGKIKNFTGVSSQYESPASPEIHVHTDQTSVEYCLNVIKKFLISNLWINNP